MQRLLLPILALVGECMRLALFMLGVTALTLVPSSAQWLNYPTAGVPRLPDGKPNLAASAPRTMDGRPDLSGLWEPDSIDATATIFNPTAVFPAEWRDIGAQPKTGLPFRLWKLGRRCACGPNCRVERWVVGRRRGHTSHRICQSD